LQAEDEAKLDRILRDADAFAGVTAGGSWQRLRGVPAIGHGVSGAVAGSNPLGALIAKESRRR
jgi:hypothetical protein